jgi:hypothetical protein
MTTAVKNILAQIATLNEAEREELQAELRLQAFEEFERLVEPERRRIAAEGLTDDDVDRAVAEIRYGKKTS